MNLNRIINRFGQFLFLSDVSYTPRSHWKTAFLASSRGRSLSIFRVYCFSFKLDYRKKNIFQAEGNSVSCNQEIELEIFAFLIKISKFKKYSTYF